MKGKHNGVRFCIKQERLFPNVSRLVNNKEFAFILGKYSNELKGQKELEK